jgi:hypothetical protein
MLTGEATPTAVMLALKSGFWATDVAQPNLSKYQNQALDKERPTRSRSSIAF